MDLLHAYTSLSMQKLQGPDLDGSFTQITSQD